MGLENENRRNPIFYSFSKILNIVTIRQLLDVQLTDYLDLIIGFVSGLLIGVATTYLGHLWSMRRTKKEEFLPYMRKLYGIVCRIMDRKDAEGLKAQHERLIEVTVKEKMREIAVKELTDGKNSLIPMSLWSPVFTTYTFFLFYLRQLIEVARECKEFESVYAEMDKKGLIQALNIRNKRLSGSLAMFHSSAEYVSEETSDIIENFKFDQTSEITAEKQFESMLQDDRLQKMLELATHNLFHYGAQLKKQLEKQV